jgi:hypothetical protein
VRPARCLALLFLVGFALSACSTNDDEGDQRTSNPAPTATLVASVPTTVTATGAAPTNGAVATLTDASGQQISDGVCRATIPDGWVDDGTGRGTTNSGARFTLFGSMLAGDAAWRAALDVVATPTTGRLIASTQRTVASIRVDFADNRGFEYRARFGDRYCDVYVYRTTGPVPDQERAVWDAVIASLGPAE